MPRIPSLRNRLKDTPVDGLKKVLLAAPRGYCAGVDRAVIAVEKALELYGAPVYVRKQIVHNTHVVSELEKQGAIFVEEVDEVPPGSHIVFSAHGVSPAVVNAAAERGLAAIDATCPLVTKVHREAVRFARDDFEILLIGHEGHEEVEGTAGEAPEHTTLVGSPDEADTITVRDPNKVVWLNQTTLSGFRTVMVSASSGLPTRVVCSGASPAVPSTSSWPSWPISKISKSSLAKRTASRCTLVTSGQVASMADRPRAAAALTTAGDTPCALKTICEPVGTSSTSSTKMAPFFSSSLTTWVLCTICLRT